MKTNLFFLFLAIVMFFAGCNKYDDEINHLEERLDALEGSSINSIEEQMTKIQASIDALKAMDTELDAYIDALRNTVSNQQNPNADVAALQSKATELESRIAALESYVDSQADYKDWAEVTFATLEQYEALQTELEGVKLDIQNINAAIADTTDAITAAYTNAIKTAITDLEDGMKEWVNDFLAESYYTKAEIDGKITALQTQVAEGDAALQKEIDDLKAALEKAESDLTAAYRQAIEDAITNNDGVIDAAIAAAITEARKELQDQIDAIDAEITAINNRLDALENNFANRIQSLTYIPTHDDGKATLKVDPITEEARAELSFFVTPKALVNHLKAEHVKVKGVYTATTRAANLIDLPVTSFNSDTVDGRITVEVSGENLTDFLAGTTNASVFLMINDGNSEYVSVHVPLVLDKPYIIDQANNSYTVYNSKGLYAWNEALGEDGSIGLVLAADITLPNRDLSTGKEIVVSNGVPNGNNWTQRDYNGVIDGRGYTISGLRINSVNHGGFIKENRQGTIKNLTLDDVVIYTTGLYVGAIVANNYGIVENCHVIGEGSSVRGEGYVGGVSGQNYEGLIIACSNVAEVGATRAVGGISGNAAAGKIIGSWTKSTSEKNVYEEIPATSDGVGHTAQDPQLIKIFSFADIASANGKIAEMNQALEDAGYSYRWETVAGVWPVVKVVE